MEEMVDMEKKFLETVDEVFDVEESDLSMDIEYKKYEKWDSFRMMNLIMELEDVFHISIPIEIISEIKTLQNLYLIVQGE